MSKTSASVNKWPTHTQSLYTQRKIFIPPGNETGHLVHSLVSLAKYVTLGIHNTENHAH